MNRTWTLDLKTGFHALKGTDWTVRPRENPWHDAINWEIRLGEELRDTVEGLHHALDIAEIANNRHGAERVVTALCQEEADV